MFLRDKLTMSNPNKIAIIPARGGSKRLPGKNIRNFLGKPVIAYSIETALKSKLFDRVMVSTDSKQIGDIAKKYGAEVPFFRSEKNSNDSATLSDTINEVIYQYKTKGVSYDFICCLLPTAPFITTDTLNRAFSLLQSGKYSSVRPVVSYSYPIQRSFKMMNGKVEFLFPEYSKTRSQDLEKMYHDAGQFYWMRSETLLNDDNRGAIVIPETQCQDIDNEEDWKLAELKFMLIKKYEK